MIGYAQLWTDGACNNKTPNGMGLGVSFRVNNEHHYYAARCEEYGGKTTSNLAEYVALLHGLDIILSLKLQGVMIHCDSEVLVKGITGEYDLKDSLLIELRDAIRKQLEHFIFWSIEWIPREYNTRADKLSKIGLTCEASTLEQQRITL